MAHWRKLHLPDPRSAAKALCGAVGVDVRRLPGPDVEQYVRLFGEAAVRERRFYNVGAGGFSHPCWTNVDYGSDWYGPVQSNFVQYDLLGTDPLPVADGTAEIVYSSHTIEHIPEDAAQRLFNEAYRVLRPGGYVRLTCPDSDLSLAALRRDDEDFFYWDRSGTPIEHKWLDHGATSLVSYFVSGWLGFAMLLYAPFHMYRQLRGTYSLGWFSALWRLIALSAFAWMALGAFALILVVMSE